MNIKCNVIVDAWLGQILVAGCEVGIFSIYSSNASHRVCVK